jgi:hypothetical protein
MQVLQHDKITINNHQLINEYLEAMKIEINMSHNYKSITLSALIKLSQFHNDMAYMKITNSDIIAYLKSLRKPEGVDPMHGWIGTYNLHLAILSRFFK